MNAVTRVAMGMTAALLAAALMAYGTGYYFCIHRHYGTIAADTDYLFANENTYAFFRPAIWIYERASGREVVLNPMIHPVNQSTSR